MKQRRAATMTSGIEAINPPTLPIRDSTIKTQAPTSIALRLPIFVTAIVCTFSVRVVEPVPVPHRPAKMLERPSSPIPRLTMPGVGGLEAPNNDAAWYEPTESTDEIRDTKHITRAIFQLKTGVPHCNG
uniref:Nucleobase-ascorbate transporter 12 n=1 Tax=Rhizophora mucronata TaxID=61149 RepID=A0A2P2M6Y0_RHIMU